MFSHDFSNLMRKDTTGFSNNPTKSQAKTGFS